VISANRIGGTPPGSPLVLAALAIARTGYFFFRLIPHSMSEWIFRPMLVML
jgi:hypothetical protein